ncbi:TlpA disulfide reductase family protein [Pelagimonas sp. KU-00592-HH]|uniref:TlpA family protein disulfide reductase n=1 Tax=Pelagimonas sp. KU-00592-HH TaxID=3127651 RepID=UPI003342AB50
MSEITEMREGDMRKLIVHKEPRPVSSKAFEDANGNAMTLADYQGKIVLLNFWATWCAPCRHEMPMLSELQSELGGDDFEVVTLSTGRGPLPAIKKFFDSINVDNLPMHRDPKANLAREMAVHGLPVTVLLNRDGQEIGRLIGDAEWNSDNAKAILARVIETSK